VNDKTVDSVVCATDAGREGELIFRLVYDFCKCTKPVQRLWISSMEDAAIRDGFEKLKPGADYDSLYHAALCRSQADWRVGINATRRFSCLYGVTLNVGRVQTPTLSLLVEREAAIAAFVKTPFYTPVLDLAGFTASGEKMEGRAAAEAVRSACDGKDVAGREIKRQNKNTAPPKLYDLTTLQREANRLFGYTASRRWTIPKIYMRGSSAPIRAPILAF
jgi:DNA topoisomerase-3